MLISHQKDWYVMNFGESCSPRCSACPLPGDMTVKCLSSLHWRRQQISVQSVLLVRIINGHLTDCPRDQLVFSRLCNLGLKTARTAICSCRFPLDIVRCCWWRTCTLSGKTARVPRDCSQKNSWGWYLCSYRFLCILWNENVCCLNPEFQ